MAKAQARFEVITTIRGPVTNWPQNLSGTLSYFKFNNLLSSIRYLTRVTADLAKQPLKALAQLVVLDQAKSPDQIDFVAPQFVGSACADLEPLEEITNRLPHQGCQLEEAACRDPDLALFIFLHDLEAHAELPADVGLSQSAKLARKAKLAPDMDVNRIRPVFFRCVAAMAQPARCFRFVRHARYRVC